MHVRLSCKSWAWLACWRTQRSVWGFWFASFLLIVLHACGEAGEFNPERSIGDAAPVWGDLPGVDGKLHSLGDLREKEVVVVLFTCNSCPYAVDYEDRFCELGNRFASASSRVGVVAINVNRIAADRLPAMKERKEAKGFAFPYLFDESQRIAREYGAVRTPECFVLDRDRKIVYMGAYDDNTKASDVKVRYVEDAIDALLSGKEIQTRETPPVGCRIRYVGERGK